MKAACLTLCATLVHLSMADKASLLERRNALLGQLKDLDEKIGRAKGAPWKPLELAQVNETEGTTGYCSGADRNALNAAGAGNSDTSVGGVGNGCGHANYNVFWGMDENNYANCFKEKIPVGQNCAS